ncbi:MAG TPA: YIP1 family protein [Thermoanaerobaculia bacterium]|nr:YIP1 family protein [Thermoanaerobaculia bacterium]
MESLRRIAQVLWAPTETFRKIGERPTWAVILVTLLVVGGILGFVAVQKIDPGDQRDMMRETFEERGLRGEELERSLDQAMAFNERFAPWFPAAGLCFGVFAYLLMALLFWGAFRLAGGEIDFVRSFAVTVHSFVPQGLSALIAIPVVLGQESIDPEAAQRGSFLASNLGFLAPEGASPALTAVLSSLDLFSLWAAILLILGFAVVARVSKGVAAGVVVSAWIVWIGIKIGLAVLFT